MGKSHPFPRCLPAGESCLFVELGDGINIELNAQVHALRRAVHAKNIQGVIETVPTYRSLAVYFDPLIADGDRLAPELLDLGRQIVAHSPAPGRLWQVPVCYGGEFGPDLESVCLHTGFTPVQVIERHTSRDLLCMMLGFTPGFPYLGGMDPALKTPRLEKPRLRVRGGSVGIAAGQTGIYPVDSPGGWRIIGRTPWVLFDPRRDPPHLIDPGDRVRFLSIDLGEFKRLREGR